jgi:hypothetical protein
LAKQFVVNDDAVSVTPRVPRHPSKWIPLYTPWDRLSSDFDPLERILAGKQLDEIVAETVSPLDVVTPEAFDALTKVPKMTLLNLYSVLKVSLPASDDAKRHWFDFVKQILCVNQERLIASVDESMFGCVRDAIDNHGYVEEFEPWICHHSNFPREYAVGCEPIVSAKYQYERGNIQLTVAKGL